MVEEVREVHNWFRDCSFLGNTTFFGKRWAADDPVHLGGGNVVFPADWTRRQADEWRRQNSWRLTRE